MKLASFFVICFCSLFLLFVDIDRAQNTKAFEMQMNNQPVETFGLARKTRRCARTRFVQYKKAALFTPIEIR